MGADGCGGCCSQQHRLHEQQLYAASRPSKRKPKPLLDDYNNTDQCCCGGESEELKMEYAFTEQATQKRKDEDTKVSEEPIAISITTVEESVSPATHGSVHTTTPKRQEEQKVPSNRFHEVPQERRWDLLAEMKVVVAAYLHEDYDERWKLLNHMTFKKVSKCTDFHIPYEDHKNDPNYKEMKCILLKNFEKEYNIKEDEMSDFKKLILWAVEMCPDIYFLDLNSSATDAEFLGQLLDVLIQRNWTMDETQMYGPEILDIENIPIKAKGIELICNYLEANIVHTKWVKIGHCFSYEIPSELSEKICNALEKNENMLKMDIELRWTQHHQQIDQILKKNNKKYKKKMTTKRKMTA